MSFLTNEKLTIVGAAGMIGSNMAQTAAMMRLTPNICLYDPFAKGLEGVVEDLRHCGFKGINFTYSSNVKEAFTNSKYMISSGGAPRKVGMTREDLLEGNGEIAAQLGKDIRSYCPDLKHLTVIFNPADITGIITLVYSGLKPSQLTTLAALDSIRLQSELAKYFELPQNKITTPRTYGGHGEKMAVFASTTKIDGKPLIDLIGTEALSLEEWEKLKERIIKCGSCIISLRGRSSFQSPAYISVEMIRAAMGGESFRWPSGCYVNNHEFKHIIMAMESSLDKNGISCTEIKGTDSEIIELKKSYEHLVRLRDKVINMGIIPSTDQWNKINPNL